jgi:hypothetical protein
MRIELKGFVIETVNQADGELNQFYEVLGLRGKPIFNSMDLDEALDFIDDMSAAEVSQ